MKPSEAQTCLRGLQPRSSCRGVSFESQHVTAVVSHVILDYSGLQITQITLAPKHQLRTSNVVCRVDHSSFIRHVSLFLMFVHYVKVTV